MSVDSEAGGNGIVPGPANVVVATNVVHPGRALRDAIDREASTRTMVFHKVWFIVTEVNPDADPAEGGPTLKLQVALAK